MTNRSKNILYSIILLISVFVVYQYRKANTSTQAIEPLHIEGTTMGTTYNITYFDDHHRDFKTSVDSLLRLVNQSINTYDPTSEVSRFNKGSRGVTIQLPYLMPPVRKAIEVFTASNGAFDPTVMPLVNAWGFGPGKQLNPDSARIDSILTFVGLNKVSITNDSIMKSEARVQLDFGGIGQGYGADVITEFLQTKGISNMLVELGGEGMAIGRNLKTNKPWEIGILDPNSTRDHQFFKAYIALTDRSFTTSGNYFNYHEVDGVKYSHTIDPATGYPARRAILSASVFAPDCTTADAWGTAFMVMGHERAIEILKTNTALDALLIYTTPDGKMETFVTSGISNIVTFESSLPQQP